MEIQFLAYLTFDLLSFTYEVTFAHAHVLIMVGSLSTNFKLDRTYGLEGVCYKHFAHALTFLYTQIHRLRH